MARAVSVSQLYSKKRKLLAFDGDFAASFGKPEQMGSWLVWGESGNGKTTFIALLCKYLTRFGKVIYNSREEGDSESMKITFKRVGMEQVGRKIVIVNEPLADLKARLKKHKAAKIVVIDSLQYMQLRYKDYTDLRDEFPNVMFLIISHAEGKQPVGKVAKDIRFDAMVKIRVQGYMAFPVSRYGGGKPFVIWQEGADEYHGAEF